MPDIINLDSIIAGYNGDPAHTPIYVVPSGAMKVLQAVINATWNEAQGSKAVFTAKMTEAMTTFLDATTTPHVSATSVTGATITEPVVDIPATQSAGDVIAVFDTKRTEIINDLVSKYAGFRAAYFPNEATVYAAAESWLAAAIADPSGLPPAVRAAIYGDDAARILSDKVRAQDAVIAQFASRRFPLPPDAANSSILQIEQKAQDAMAESSRKVAMLSVEQQKFNVEKILSLRGMALDAANKYIAALVSGQDIASKVIGVGYDAQSKLISAVSSFYSQRVNAAEAMNKVAQYNSSAALEAAAKNQLADLQMVENKLKALLSEAQSVAQMVTALYNNLHANVGLSTTGGASMTSSVA